MNETGLIIGHEPDFAPLTFIDGIESRGLVIEIVIEALGRIGVTPNFTSVPLSEHEAAVRTGKIDAVAFKAIIPEREREYDFSIPFTTSGAAWFVLPSCSLKGSQPAAGARLATPRKGPLIAQLRRDYPYAVILDVNSYSEALGAVVNGDADCAALNFHMGCYLANRDYSGQFELPDSSFLESPLGFAFAKGLHSEIRVKFNQAVEEMKSSGIVEAIERRWLAN